MAPKKKRKSPGKKPAKISRARPVSAKADKPGRKARGKRLARKKAQAMKKPGRQRPKAEHSVHVVGSRIDFCAKCGSIMVPNKKKSVVILKCRNCASTMKKNIKTMKFVEAVKDREGVVVIEKDSMMLPKTDKLCEKCGNRKAYWWLQQTKDDDEAPTQFFRCSRCKHVWREDK